jgi:hypothetical protein
MLDEKVGGEPDRALSPGLLWCSGSASLSQGGMAGDWTLSDRGQQRILVRKR